MHIYQKMFFQTCTILIYLSSSACSPILDDEDNYMHAASQTHDLSKRCGDAEQGNTTPSSTCQMLYKAPDNLDQSCAADFVPSLHPGGYGFNHGVSLYGSSNTAALFEQTNKAVLDAGDLTVVGKYIDTLARCPFAMQKHVGWVLNQQSGNWIDVDAPLFVGAAMTDESSIHRMLQVVGSYKDLLIKNARLTGTLSTGLLTPTWVAQVESIFHAFLNNQGFFANCPLVCNMAQVFHSMRSGLPAVGVNISHVWQLADAQRVVLTMLTTPYILNAQDANYVASKSYLQAVTHNNAAIGESPDITLIDGSDVLFTGGLFIGWKPNRPALHGTWDGLVIFNLLYNTYPEPDPTSPNSIFYLWYQQPEDVKQQAKIMFTTLVNKLWLDYKHHNGPSYCHIVNGAPSEDLTKPSEAQIYYDYAGYTLKDMIHWAYLVYGEIYNYPTYPPYYNAGVQTLLQILGVMHG